jgi:nicotinamide-nucleotide amidase
MVIAAEILTTGDELLRGDVVNTNAAWLAARLRETGVALARVVTVGDDLLRLAAAMREAVERCALLLVSGGLGPTDDDRTTEAVARATGLELELHSEALQSIRERFARFGAPMTRNNEKQAWIPRGAQLLPNPVGTAPGYLARAGRCHLVCMPGVPFELKTMFDTQVVPWIVRELGVTPALVRSLNVFGLGESQMDHRLQGLQDAAGARGASCGVTVHYRTSFPENRVILVVRPGTKGREEAEGVLEQLEREARARLGHHVFGVDGETFSAAVVDALREARATLALAESCTGGLAGDLVTRAPGSSEVFGLGAIVYSNTFKARLLGVSETVLASQGAVSRECVVAMAEGVRALSGATYGAGISGIAGPGGGTADKPVGTVHFALASARGTRHLHRVFPFDRERVKLISAYTVLALVLHEAKERGPLAEDPLQGRYAPEVKR